MKHTYLHYLFISAKKKHFIYKTKYYIRMHVLSPDYNCFNNYKLIRSFFSSMYTAYITDYAQTTFALITEIQLFYSFSRVRRVYECLSR